MSIPSQHLEIAPGEQALRDGLGDGRARGQGGGDFARGLVVAVDGFEAGFVEGEVGAAEGEVVGECALIGGAGGEDEGRGEGAGGGVDARVVDYARRGCDGGAAVWMRMVEEGGGKGEGCIMV